MSARLGMTAWCIIRCIILRSRALAWPGRHQCRVHSLSSRVFYHQQPPHLPDRLITYDNRFHQERCG
jgi:hypothetical protein